MRALVMTCVVVGMLLAASVASACTLTRVRKGAKLKVYFTRFAKEDNTGGKYKKCRFVKQGGTTFLITPFRQDANVIVHKSNWPR